MWSACLPFGVSTGCRCAGSLWLALRSWCVPLLLPSFSLCAWCVACEYGSISHFKGGFRGFLLLDVCLYYFDALRGLWGFCVREWLGGFMSCCVFVFIFRFFSVSSCFLSFCPFVFFSCPLVLLSSCSPAWLPALPAFLFFVLFSWLCGLAFGFGFLSLSDGHAKRKGARVLPCVLACLVVSC